MLKVFMTSILSGRHEFYQSGAPSHLFLIIRQCLQHLYGDSWIESAEQIP